MTTRFPKIWHLAKRRDRKAMHMETLSIETLSIGLALAIRIVLVLRFLPFSALDKVLDFRGAVAQAQEAVSSKGRQPH